MSTGEGKRTKKKVHLISREFIQIYSSESPHQSSAAMKENVSPLRGGGRSGSSRGGERERDAEERKEKLLQDLRFFADVILPHSPFSRLLYTLVRGLLYVVHIKNKSLSKIFLLKKMVEATE